MMYTVSTARCRLSAKMCVQMPSSGTKEPHRIPLHAGKLDKAMRRALDETALGQGGAPFSLWASRPRCREVGQADPRGLAGQDRKRLAFRAEVMGHSESRDMSEDGGIKREPQNSPTSG